jgi:hypothetical protein
MAVKTKRKALQDTAKRSVSSKTQASWGKTRKLTTAITFTAAYLAAIADYLAAGMVMLRISTPHRVVSKLKAAMSRLHVPVPRGL